MKRHCSFVSTSHSIGIWMWGGEWKPNSPGDFLVGLRPVEAHGQEEDAKRQRKQVQRAQNVRHVLVNVQREVRVEPVGRHVRHHRHRIVQKSCTTETKFHQSNQRLQSPLTPQAKPLRLNPFRAGSPSGLSPGLNAPLDPWRRKSQLVA